MGQLHHLRTAPAASCLWSANGSKTGESVYGALKTSGPLFFGRCPGLSRLARQGLLQRLSKGVYYRGRETALGKSLPNPAAIQKLAARDTHIFPSGLAAANVLGYTTQTTSRPEVATMSLSLPRKLIGDNTIIHTRRPEAWAGLSRTDAALLDFLRAEAKQVSCRRSAPSAGPLRFSRKRTASSVCSKSLTLNHHGCVRCSAPSANRWAGILQR